MAEWFYSLDNQQKGPVTWESLRQLAASGKLSRGDLVWREGLADWKPASQIENLLPRAEAAAPKRREESFAAEADLPRRREAPIDEEDADERRPRRKKKRKKEHSPGAMAAIIGSSVGGGILVLIIIIVLLVRSGRGNPAVNAPGGAQAQGGGGAAGFQPINYAVTLRPFQDDTRAFNFQAGQRVEVLVSTPQAVFKNPDVDLYISRAGDPEFDLVDDAISKDCYLQFVAPANDQYFIRVVNLGPGIATSTVTIR